MSRASVRIALVALCLAVGGQATAAQSIQRRGVSFSGETVLMRVGSEVGGRALLSGVVLGAGVGIGMPYAGIEARYLQGAVEDSAGSGPDVAQGELLLRVTPLSWFAVRGGPLVRSYVTGTTRERWLQWVVRARADIPLFSDVVSYVEGSWGLGGSFSASTRFDNARGGEAGVFVQVSRVLAGRVGYRVDRVSLGSGTRQQTVEELTVGLMVGLGR